MKSVILLTFSFLFLLIFKAKSQRTISAVPAEAEIFFQRAMAEINSNHVTWIKRTAMVASNQNLNESEIRKIVTDYGMGINLGLMEVESLISFVMMIIANDAEEDLKQMMNAMNELKKEKEKIIQGIAELEKNKTNITRLRLDSLRLFASQKITAWSPTRQNTQRTNETVKRVNEDSIKRRNNAFNRVSSEEINQVEADLKTKMITADEVGELNSLQIQMMMDRRSKFISTLGNIMKKINQTQDSIIQNLK